MNRPRKKRRSNKSKNYKRFTPEGTLSSPSLSLCLELVSKLIYRHVLLRDGCVGSRRNKEWEEKFDIDNFLEKRYITVMPFNPVSVGPTIYSQRQFRTHVNVPSFEHIHRFFRFIFTKLHLNVGKSHRFAWEGATQKKGETQKKVQKDVQYVFWGFSCFGACVLCVRMCLLPSLFCVRAPSLLHTPPLRRLTLLHPNKQTKTKQNRK